MPQIEEQDQEYLKDSADKQDAVKDKVVSIDDVAIKVKFQRQMADQDEKKLMQMEK